MADNEQVEKWISEFEATGEQTVRDNINFRGALMGGEEKLSTALTWLRNRERRREEEVTAALNYIRWTFWVTVAAAVFVIGTFAVVIVVLVLHR
ncbi:hypothetical protein [Bradyrhizobium erythrophlei]|jgi:hypothetical protein|uniref:Uncharacterized protein n=1 Tax=Bradyrhizobium erythrophlei TaxID=1437360 RepID=A0A1M7UHW3_9BRAD|nr:hypothetical protein [Bradyrhizobium erythrophlei]SHN82603.1 hypothetical protein SAMN05444170_5166 [Bradyrhizobium erythrophlei]